MSIHEIFFQPAKEAELVRVCYRHRSRESVIISAGKIKESFKRWLHLANAV
jgi:hypothetical protein